jgi:hypothetical protein
VTTLERTGGWIEAVQGVETNIERAIEYVYSLRDIYPEAYDITTDHIELQNQKYSTISIALKAAEIQTAPEAIHRLFQDIGVTTQDKVLVELNIPEEPTHFIVSYIPEQITDSKVGIVLSTQHDTGSVRVLSRKSPRERSVIQPVVETYRGLSRNVMRNEKGESQLSGHHPFLENILVSSADWIGHLLHGRLREKDQQIQYETNLTYTSFSDREEIGRLREELRIAEVKLQLSTGWAGELQKEIDKLEREVKQQYNKFDHWRRRARKAEERLQNVTSELEKERQRSVSEEDTNLSPFDSFLAGCYLSTQVLDNMPPDQLKGVINKLRKIAAMKFHPNNGLIPDEGLLKTINQLLDEYRPLVGGS